MLLQCKSYRWNIHLIELNLMDLLVILIMIAMYITGSTNLSFPLLNYFHIQQSRKKELCRSDCDGLFGICQSPVTYVRLYIGKYFGWHIVRNCRKPETQTSMAISPNGKYLRCIETGLYVHKVNQATGTCHILGER